MNFLIQRADAANKILHSMAVISIIKMKVNPGLTNMSIAHTTKISSPFSVSLPEQLRTPKAIRLLKVAMENDLLADDLTPIISMNKATIFASPTDINVGDHVGDVSEIKLTERQQVILNIIKESPSITAKQMSETLSVSPRTVERDLSTLKEKGVLKREGKDNDGFWIMILY